MPRPRTFDEAEVLERAVDLFREVGYERASIPELTDRLGSCRQSLYSSFGSKRDLYLAALARYGAREVDAKLDELRAQRSPLDGLRGLLAGWAGFAEHCPTDGCLTVNAIIEADDAEARAAVEVHVERLEAGLRAALAAAVEAGELRADTPVERLARAMITTCYGIGVLGKLASSGPRLADAVEDLLERLDGYAS